MRITIVGGGISGLSTAYALLKTNHEIRIIAKEFTPLITSNKAAAFWFPYHIRNDQRGISWGKFSYAAYENFSKNPGTGISMQQLIKVVRKEVEEQEMTWVSFMPQGSYRVLEQNEYDEVYKIAYEVRVPLIETQIFLPWLMNELEKRNVLIAKKEIQSFDEIDDADLIINCAGLGARKLCNDEEVIPIRGQVALLSPNKNCSIFLDNELPLYIVSRKDAMIVGGTYEEGIDEELTVPSTIEKLLQNAYDALPELRRQTFQGSWAGIRPYRPLVRVEKEGNIIHNYGHGGSGFTLAWGCANDVVSLIGN
jgi:D-amino-acid oxidase